MAAPAPGSVVFGPGRLVSGPTNLALAYPYGGTELGLVADTYLEIAEGSVPIYDEGMGCRVDVIEGAGEMGQVWTFGCLSRTRDSAMLATLFRSTAVGASSGQRVIQYDPRGSPGGTLGSARAIVLLFVADHPLHHPSLLLAHAAPMLEAQAQLALDLVDELQFPAIFEALPTASGGAVPGQFGLFSDLSLT